MSTSLTIATPQLPSTEIAADYDDLAKGGAFLQRLQLFTKGKPIDKGLVKPGHYGVPVSEDEVTDLGDSVDIIPLARRPKAVDMSDKESIVTSYDDKSDEFKRIAQKAGEKESNCMFGVSFLVYERSTARFYEMFFGTKSSRPEAKNLYPFLPTAEKPATAASMKSRYVEKKSWSWHVPVVTKCSTPFAKLPTEAQVVDEIGKFLNPKTDEVEVVKEEPGSKRRAR